MNIADFPPLRRRALRIERRCAMRLETMRHQIARARSHGSPMSDAAHLAAHRESYAEGARAMADAIQAEISELRLRELAEIEAAGNVVIPIFGASTENSLDR